MTKLAYYCNKVMEWGWLAVIVYIPLYFNVYSSRVFEPDKLSMLRSIVLVMAVAWGIKVLEGLGSTATANARASGRGGVVAVANGGWPTSAWWRIPLLVPILLYALMYLITSIASVVPETSFLGSYQRLQGLFSQYSYIMLALIIIFNVRSRAQVERIITFAILTSVPVALYGLMQHERLDPLPWAGDVVDRVASSMGNAIFVGAWLIMVVPLVLYRLFSLVARLRDPNSDLEREIDTNDSVWVLGYGGVAVIQSFVLWMALYMMAGNQRPDFGLWFILPIAILVFYLMNFIYGTARKNSRALAWAQVVGLGLLLPLLVTIVVFTASRGPELGLMAGVIFFLISLLWVRRMWKSLAVVGVFVALFVGFLVVFNLPNSPIAGLRDAKYIGKLGQIFQTDDGTGKVRLLIWSGDINMIKADPLRSLIGWGPESMYVAYNKFYPAELQHWELRNATPDRSHNAYLDQIVIMGFSGLFLYLLLIGSFFFFVFRALRRTDRFVNQALILGLAGGVVADLVEIAVGIPIAVTYTYFYTYIALFVAFAFYIEKILQPSASGLVEQLKSDPFGDKEKETSSVMARMRGLLQPQPRLSLALAGAGSGAAQPITTAYSTTSNRPGSAAGSQRKGSGNRNKANRPPAAGSSPRPAAVPPASANGNVATPTAPTGNGSVEASSSPATPITPAPKPQSQLQRAPATNRQRIASGRVDQSRVRPLTRWIANPAFVWLYGVMAVVALLLIWLVNINLVYADMLYKQGQSAESQQNWPAAVQVYQDAIKLQPDQDYYYLFLGRAYMEWSKGPTRFQQLTADQAATVRDQLIAKSEQTLLKAQQLNPLNTDHYANLGRLYIYWGGILGQGSAASDHQNAIDKMTKGIDYYTHATQLSPQNAQIWNELALAQRTLALYQNSLNPSTAQTSGSGTSTQTVSGTGTVSNSTALTSTTPVTPTTGTTDNSNDATKLPLPVRGAGINPEAMTMLEAAETTAKQSAKIDDRYGNTYYILGEIERSLGDAPQTADAYVKLIKLIKLDTDQSALPSLTDSEISTRADFLVAGKVYTDVVDALKLTTTKPATPDEAQKNPVMGIHADDTAAYNFLGFLYWKSNQIAAAIPTFDKVTSLSPSDYYVHRNLSVLYGLNKQPAPQLAELAKCRDILNSGAGTWQSFFSSQADHDNELATVNATISQVESSSGLKAPAAPPTVPTTNTP